MIEPHRRNDTDRGLDDIRGIVLATEAYLQNERICDVARKGEKRRSRRDLEECDRRAVVGTLAIVQRRGQFVLTDDLSRQPDAFVKMHKMWRGVDVNLQ